MMKIVSTALGGQLRTLDAIEEGCWIHLCNPTEYELNVVEEETEIEDDLLRAALDDNETPRTESYDESTLVLVDIPVVKPEGDSFIYSTVPLGIIVGENHIVTVTTEENTLLDSFWEGKYGRFETHKKMRFTLQILNRNSSRFLSYLRQIEKQISQIESVVVKAMNNRELLQMLNTSKSLTYFSASLKSNEIVLEKLMKGSTVRRYQEDTELLEDIIIDNRQAIEMCSIYKEISNGMADAFASIIGNNQQVAMKLQAALSILMAIPTIISGFWGMNLPVPWETSGTAFYLIIGISAVATLVTAFFLWRKKLF